MEEHVAKSWPTENPVTSEAKPEQQCMLLKCCSSVGLAPKLEAARGVCHKQFVELCHA